MVSFSDVLVDGDIHTTVQYFSGTAPEPATQLWELLELFDTERGLPVMRSLDAYRLGATATRYGHAGRSGSHDPYVPRTRDDVDARLSATLDSDRLVLLTGPSKAGKTRTLFEAVRTRFPDARVAVPRPGMLDDLANRHEFLTCDDTIVVWLENLDRYLTIGRPLRPATLARLTDRAARTVVVATLRNEARDQLRQNLGELTHDTRMVLANAIEIALAPTSEDAREHDAAARAYPALNLDRYGLAEILASAPELLERYDDSRYSDPALHTLIQVSVDWLRIGLDEPIPEATLIALAADLLDDARPDLELDRAAWEGVMRKARTPPAGAGRVALLLTSRLTDRSRGYRPFDYLVATDDGYRRAPRPIPDAFWHNATRDTSAPAVLGVAYSAYTRGRLDDAEVFLRRAADGGEVDALLELANLVGDRDGEYEELHRRAAALGDTRAMTNLGVWLYGEEPDEAERLWRQAADAGDGHAMNNLGNLIRERDDLVTAEHWWRRAAETGHSQAMDALGCALYQRDDFAEAQSWWRRAAEAGHSRAMYRLGLVSLERDDDTDAEAWWRRAAQDHDKDAKYQLGLLLYRRGEVTEAESWFYDAAFTGHLDAMYQYAAIRAEAGASTHAQHWYRLAAEDGHIEAMVDLAVLIVEYGDREFQRWWTPSVDFGTAQNLFILGEAYDQPEKTAKAEYWYRLAVEAGHPDAPNKLNALLARRGGAAEAETWLRQATSADHLDAMNILGLLLEERGERVEAQEWYQRAAELGHADAMNNLGCALEETGHPVEAENWFLRAAESGDPVAMRNLAELLTAQGHADRAACWLRRASDSAPDDLPR